MDIPNEKTLLDKFIEQALIECAELHFASDVQRLRWALLQGQCEYCKCLSDYLINYICQYLEQNDSTVKSVYQVEPVNFTQGRDEPIGTPGKERTGINLVALVGRKSAGLSALIKSLEVSLPESLRKFGCPIARPGCYTLNIEVVSENDVQERRGVGLLIEFANIRSKQVWQRPTQPGLPVPEIIPAPSRVGVPFPESFDPELIPESRLLEHALAIEKTPPADRAVLAHHLMELKVILIRRIISDQLAYIDIAKRWFSVSDIADIYQRRIGDGRIGGKSAGMLLAARILNEVADDEVRACFQIPNSYFLGSDLIYIFMAMNGLMYWNDQKHKPEDQIRNEYPRIREEFQSGSFPPEILAELKELLIKIGKNPIIVRSSSQLEDNFGTSFAGKYDSFFCPNQGNLEQNLAELTRAITQTYASTLKPEALLYRRSKGLEDYDERMAVLIQVVQGEQFGKYFFPQGAGVAFSRNLYRWSPQIQREAGFARLVWGLGTRAVQRTGDDYPRLVALSHPTLQPDDTTEAIRLYSQRKVDVIDLEDNSVRTLPVHDVLTPNYPPLRLIAQLEQEGYFITPRMQVQKQDLPALAITYQELLRRTHFASLLSRMLRLLEKHYHSAVDMEFTVHISEISSIEPKAKISLLQCRPQSQIQDVRKASLPEVLPNEDVIFTTRFMVPQGYLPDIRYIVYVKPEAYFGLPTQAARIQISQAIARLNAVLKEKTFILVGPGRWGSANTDLGVYVSYADIDHASALIELSGKGVGSAPEPSLGTHFFQDLMEAGIYPLAIQLDDVNTQFNRDFFYQGPNVISDYLTVGEPIVDCVRVIEVACYRPGYHLELVMDDEKNEAIGFLVKG
jgi:hypothetical protein